LQEYSTNIVVYDPWVNKEAAVHEYGLGVDTELPSGNFDAVILAVAHQEFLQLDIKSMLAEGGVIYDVKGVLSQNTIDGRL
jgi:UDP-N-acetyl-D-galactosamine dehydrogenase